MPEQFRGPESDEEMTAARRAAADGRGRRRAPCGDRGELSGAPHRSEGDRATRSRTYTPPARMKAPAAYPASTSVAQWWPRYTRDTPIATTITHAPIMIGQRRRGQRRATMTATMP